MEGQILQGRTDPKTLGFTLLELLVVLAIMSTVLVSASRTWAYRSHSIRYTAGQLLVDLRQARAQAVTADKVVSLKLLENGTGYTVSLLGPVVRTFPTGTTVSIDHQPASRIQASDRIAFFGDGSANSATIWIRRQQDTEVITINGLSGSVHSRRRTQ